MSTMMPIPQNFRKNVDWILGAYTDAGVTFSNGFQKDAIQNAVGARKHDRWTQWKCDISLIENAHGTFVVVEDSGTVGLIGQNLHGDIVNAMMAREEVLPAEERLARFTSMFNSGGNSLGSGLFGAGKSVYSVASQEYLYYFDSLREDGLYVANINNKGQVFPLALEDDEAKSFIKENTGLSAKKTSGTRVIIKSPKPELVSDIKSGKIIEYMQESWWLIIQRLGEDSCISLNGKPITVPSRIFEGRYKFELQTPEASAPNYKVKHFGLYVFPDGDNIWEGIAYYRKGMKIGEIELKDIPDKINGKFWGYIEVDKAWESELATIEDNVHFGVSKGKKRNLCYQNLKNYCNSKIRANLIEWGFIRDKESEDKKLKDKLQKIAEDIQGLFDKLGFEDLGKGPQKADFDVRWQNIRYPVKNSETVTTGDRIDFSVRIKSSYATDKKFEYRLYVQNPQNGNVITQLASKTIDIKSNTVYVENFSYTVNRQTSEIYAENRIVLSVKVTGSGKEKRKELQFFYDCERPDKSREAVSLVLHECLFPNQGSRRVDFGSSIRNVAYRIENKRNYELHYRLNVSVHNASIASCPKIIDVASFVGVLPPFEDAITPSIPEVVFDESTYRQHLSEGTLELRARLIANEDDQLYEKGDKITVYHYKLFLNCDEKNGKNDAFAIKSVDDPSNYRRSWHTAGSDRSIYLNVGHAAYLSVEEFPEIQMEYLREQMLKQYVLLYLAEGKYDMFGAAGAEFGEMEPQEATECVLERIETVYYESLK